MPCLLQVNFSISVKLCTVVVVLFCNSITNVDVHDRMKCGVVVVRLPWRAGWPVNECRRTMTVDDEVVCVCMLLVLGWVTQLRGRSKQFIQLSLSVHKQRTKIELCTSQAMNLFEIEVFETKNPKFPPLRRILFLSSSSLNSFVYAG